MDIEYLHLYVRNTATWGDWFVKTLNFQPVSPQWLGYPGEMAVQSADILVLLSSHQSSDPGVGQFLNRHAEGVGDVAFRVHNLDATVAQIQAGGGYLSHPVQTQDSGIGPFRWCRMQGWGSLRHTLIERQASVSQPPQGIPWLSIDHAVLNVPVGQLAPAITWYERQLGFVKQQQFTIATAQSGLRSFVLKHPQGSATLPINEPTSANSQIQEFLDLHQGAGIQHVALRTADLVATIACLRQRGLSFLPVPSTYYQQLRYRPGFWHDAGDWDAIAQQQILVDWPPDDPQTRLLQTFTNPLFERPTFFWELIERQVKTTQGGVKQAEGFGAGNFQALFEAIEREQQQRGSL